MRLRPALAALLLLVAACDVADPVSLYDPDAPAPRPVPAIEAVDPPAAAYAGVSEVTIRGRDFDPDPARNLVYFGSERAVVLSATATSLTVRAPNRPEPDLGIRLTVLGAPAYSNTVDYDLLPVVQPFGRIAGFEEPFSIATLDDGKVLSSLFSTNVSAGIVEVAPGGARPVYAATTFKWDALHAVPGEDAVLAVRGVRAVFRFPRGGAQQTFAVAADAALRFTALEVTADGTVWAGGTGGGANGNLYRIPPGGAPEPAGFAPTVRDLVVADGTLYVLGTDGDGSALWRFPIGGDGTLGTGDRFVDVTAAAGAEGRALAAATSGELFVGTAAAEDPLLVVTPDGAAETLYPGLLEGPFVSLAWGPDGVLYAVRGRAVGIAPGMVRIVTLREGVR